MYLPVEWSKILEDPLARRFSFWVCPLVGVLLILSIPKTILDESHLLAVIAQYVSEVVPSIDQWVARSSFPQITKVFFAYCWLSMPFQIMIIVRHKPSESHSIQKWTAKPATRYWRSFLLFSSTGIIFLLYFYFALPEEESCTWLCVHLTKIVQGTYGVVMSSAVSGLIALVVWWIKDFRIIFMDKPGGRGKQELSEL
ncbi:MAG: hypothetical protein GXY80_09945 [Syntrophorhabdus aromaticivorans]|jgi:hypothetical protein|uniref:Uncharacterized protein n=1 Tax=Syntrophorhabdus aromaticivorans TaxID=328301 RepID=A0A971M4D0_9BACT|nr:hypothetical protein [Syntrophorhabdus aromaticivorans]